MKNPSANHSEVTSLPSGLSPLIRKLIICEQTNKNYNKNVIEVMHSCSCSGFNSAPLLLYSDIETESKAYIDKTE